MMCWRADGGCKSTTQPIEGDDIPNHNWTREGDDRH